MTEKEHKLKQSLPFSNFHLLSMDSYYMILIVLLDFWKICLLHPSTMALLMLFAHFHKSFKPEKLGLALGKVFC